MNPNHHFESFRDRIDQGPNPFVTNLSECTLKNNNVRSALWTGCNLQLTLMNIQPNSEIGLECHNRLDQFLYIESGSGTVMMGKCKCSLDYQCKILPGCAIIIPANTWHNIVNTGCCPLNYFPSMHRRSTRMEPCIPQKSVPTVRKATINNKK